MNGLELKCENIGRDLMEEIISRIDEMKLVNGADNFYALFYIIDFLKDKREIINSIYKSEWIDTKKIILGEKGYE